MKINWKVRLRSGPFWTGVLSAFLVLLYALCGLFGIELPFAQAEVLNVALLLLAFLAAVGVVSDPTTKGIEDSERAMGYRAPAAWEEDGTQ